MARMSPATKKAERKLWRAAKRRYERLAEHQHQWGRLFTNQVPSGIPRWFMPDWRLEGYMAYGSRDLYGGSRDWLNAIMGRSQSRTITESGLTYYTAKQPDTYPKKDRMRWIARGGESAYRKLKNTMRYLALMVTKPSGVSTNDNMYLNMYNTWKSTEPNSLVRDSYYTRMKTDLLTRPWVHAPYNHPTDPNWVQLQTHGPSVLAYTAWKDAA